MAVEAFARRAGIRCIRNRNHEGSSIDLGAGWRFDDYDEAMAFLAPGLRTGLCRTRTLCSPTKHFVLEAARAMETDEITSMLTRDDIQFLEDLTKALSIPFRSSQDAQGLIAHIDSGSTQRECACRTLREAVSVLAAHAPNQIERGGTRTREGENSRTLGSAYRRDTGLVEDFDLLTGSD